MQLWLYIFSLIIAVIYGRKGFGPTDQEWGFVNVREGAHLFWWLHKTSAKVDDYTERPLVIWVQGGPGSSSTGFGNFGEIGPLDGDLKPRDDPWTKDVNVLFVDSPAGTGFSYVDNVTSFATNNRQIAEDYLVMLKEFYETVPELQKSPLYIFGESYGGKMTVEIALLLDQAIKNGEFNITLYGIGLGDPWISPIDSVLSWGPYLLNLGVIDQQGYEAIQHLANKTRDAVNEGRWLDATENCRLTEVTIGTVTEDVDFYNILIKKEKKKTLREKIKFKWIKSWIKTYMKPTTTADIDEKLEYIMNTKVAKALNITHYWGSPLVAKYLREDNLKPVTHIVEQLLNTTDIQVVVYNGQLDLIVDTPGTVAWVGALKFPQAAEWPKAPRTSVVVNGIIEGYVKRAGNLAMYWVNRSGHMVPIDNPSAMWKILIDATKNFGV